MEKPVAAAESAARELAERLGTRLHAVVLYGSAARDEFVAAHSDINLLVLLDRIDADAIGRLAAASTHWDRRRINAMLLEEEEWTRATDAFAIELLDMKDARRVLHGEDPVEPLTIERRHARLQAERELRGRTIALHNGMVRCAGSPADLGALLIAAIPSFATYLRATLRLAGQTVPGRLRDVIEQGSRLIGAPANGLIRALEAREANGTWEIRLDSDIIADFNDAAARTARFIDSLGGN